MPRIIAGRFKGRVLDAPRGDETRPTSDRVKESLFSILGADLSDLYVIDIFAGTGSLGLEALSRGAKHAVLVEKEPAPLKSIRNNVDALGVRDQVTIIALNAMRVVPSLPKADLVFADPPYALKELDDFVASIFLSTVIRPGGLMVLETAAKRLVQTPMNATLSDERVYGETKLSFYRPK